MPSREKTYPKPSPWKFQTTPEAHMHDFWSRAYRIICDCLNTNILSLITSYVVIVYLFVYATHLVLCSQSLFCHLSSLTSYLFNWYINFIDYMMYWCHAYICRASSNTWLYIIHKRKLRICNNKITRHLLRNRKYILKEHIIHFYISRMHKELTWLCSVYMCLSQYSDCRQTFLFFIWLYNLAKASTGCFTLVNTSRTCIVQYINFSEYTGIK